jgi:hypothetical protein
MISIAKKSSKAGNEKFVAVSEEIQGWWKNISKSLYYNIVMEDDEIARLLKKNWNKKVIF